MSEAKSATATVTPLTEPLSEALLTDDGKLGYPVSDGIPVLLEGEAIDVQVDA